MVFSIVLVSNYTSVEYSAENFCTIKYSIEALHRSQFLFSSSETYEFPSFHMYNNLKQVSVLINNCYFVIAIDSRCFASLQCVKET